MQQPLRFFEIWSTAKFEQCIECKADCWGVNETRNPGSNPSLQRLSNEELDHHVHSEIEMNHTYHLEIRKLETLIIAKLMKRDLALMEYLQSRRI
jgi:hypothetical protein